MPDLCIKCDTDLTQQEIAVDDVDMLISNGLCTRFMNSVFGWWNNNVCIGLLLSDNGRIAYQNLKLFIKRFIQQRLAKWG